MKTHNREEKLNIYMISNSVNKIIKFNAKKNEE
jgi:hypothetical protein